MRVLGESEVEDREVLDQEVGFALAVLDDHVGLVGWLGVINIMERI